MSLTRRQALRNGLRFAGAVPLVFAGGRSRAGGNPSYGDVPALKDIAADRGLKIGNAINGTENQYLIDLVKQHCSAITPTNHWKPSLINSKGQADYSIADKYHLFAMQNDMSIHGHTLFWYRSKLASKRQPSLDELYRSYGAHVKHMVGRYKDVAESWDVANEIVSGGKNKDLLRADRELKLGGFEFIDFLFRTASEADPNASLHLNDYSLCFQTEWAEAKRQRFLEIIRKLIKQGTPLHGIGIQAHLRAKYGFDAQAVSFFINELEKLGLEVHISELDVNDASLPADREQRDQLVADIYREAIDTFLKFESVKKITFWGFTDKHNHIALGYAPDSRKDGDSRPALFDNQLKPKKSFWAVARALESRKA